MLNVRDTVAPTLPALSIGRTTTVCAPAARPVNAFGLAQAAKAPPSRLHWKPCDVAVGARERRRSRWCRSRATEPIAALGAALSMS